MLEIAWTKKTGRPPKDLDCYPTAIAHALLFCWDAAQDEIDQIADEWEAKQESSLQKGFRKRLPRKPKWGDVLRTGDPLGDRWEEQIANGETPDFDEVV